VGCSSSSPSGPLKPVPDGGDAGDARTDAGVPKDVGADVIVDPKNCVPPGTIPNSQGAGGYCSPGGGQCDMVGPGGVAEICTADLSGTPAHDWFCTLPCMKTPECGAGATCAPTPMGSHCVPESCDSFVPDGGPVDAGMPDGEEEAGPGDASADSALDGPG
jgi:hypothetical protein